MGASKSIDQFLEELRLKDVNKHKLITRLRSIVIKAHPDVRETIKYGGIMFALEENFGGLFASKNHVSFEFSYGYKLTTDLKLEGSGKYRRHIKYKGLDDVSEEKLIIILKQIASLQDDRD